MLATTKAQATPTTKATKAAKAVKTPKMANPPKRQRAPKAAVSRLANGLRIGWSTEFKDGSVGDYHSLRDFSFALRERGVDILKVEKLRAFLRRVGTKKSTRKAPPAWLGTILSISRNGNDTPIWTTEAEGNGASDGMGDVTDDSAVFACEWDPE